MEVLWPTGLSEGRRDSPAPASVQRAHRNSLQAPRSGGLTGPREHLLSPASEADWDDF